MTQIIKHKIGDTFFAACTFRDDSDSPASLTVAGLTVTSTVRMPNTLNTVNLTVTLLNQTTFPGRYNLTCDDTSAWQAGLASWDIQYSSGVIVSSTETVKIRVKRDLTP